MLKELKLKIRRLVLSNEMLLSSQDEEKGLQKNWTYTAISLCKRLSQMNASVQLNRLASIKWLVINAHSWINA